MDYGFDLQLREFVNATSSDWPLLSACAAEAAELVDAYIGDGTVPEPIRNRAIVEVGSELFHRRNAPGGITQFAAEGTSPVRMARDPMLGAYPILNRYLPAGLA